MRKIGLLTQAEKVKHNLEIVKNRKSEIEFQGLYKEKKEFNRLRKISKSLPKLEKFYSKKAEIVYNSRNMNKFLNL